VLRPPVSIQICGSSSVFGSRLIPSEEIDRAFSMPEGKLRQRAGILSLAYATEGEDETNLGCKAAHEALHAASCRAEQIDWLIATSETHHAYPSLAAQLHSRLGLREDCGAMDVGGACLGLLHGFHAASAFLQGGQAEAALVVTADVHSRILAPGRVPGEFGGLFGDGASAFVLQRLDSTSPNPGYLVGGLFFGFSDQYSGAIRLAENLEGKVGLVFDGEALSRAAITKLESVVEEIEARSGISRSAVKAFATHQPNPRLVALLSRQLGVPASLFPDIARVHGNLGSSTCGAALDAAIKMDLAPVFLASLGPGLLWGGGWLFVPAG
jgi:3-oxoacyl-[acyl-carrier-protein] synthase III